LIGAVVGGGGAGARGAATRPTQEKPKAAPSVTIPNVVGMTVAEATEALGRARLEVNSEIEYVLGPPPGEVFDTNPDVGERVKRGRTVTLRVGRQPPGSEGDGDDKPNKGGRGEGKGNENGKGNGKNKGDD
ncbi:MAG TPA: PASTA domain-containing protein, partial [Actinomycetota bacterium]|nr:PASTA domain-containing protein [Actinomycetota bacterium]